jgi:hypothetical protein
MNNNSVQSWFDLPIQEPVDPRILIANAKLGSIQGAFARSTNFIGALSWIASPFSLSGVVTCASLHTDDALAVAEAQQWNFSHKAGNFAATLAPPLRKVLFLRGGAEYQMSFEIDLGPETYSDLQLSFRDNAAVSGNFTGTAGGSIPVILFSGAATGPQTLFVSLKQYGTFQMAISARDGSGNWSMFEMDWVIVF